MTSASEMLKIFERRLAPIIPKLSNGLASLPDELLRLIFQFATHHEQEGTRHAMWLSHVSRRFRKLVLADRSLWSTQFLAYDTSKENIEEFIRRSGKDTDLHIVMGDNSMIEELVAKDFWGACLPFASQWRTFAVVGDWNREYSNVMTKLGGSLGKFLVWHHLVLPRLHELSINHQHYKEPSVELMWYSSTLFFPSETWVTPNLRIVRCVRISRRRHFRSNPSHHLFSCSP